MVSYLDILNDNTILDIYNTVDVVKRDFPLSHGLTHIKNVIKIAKHITQVFNLSEEESQLLLMASVLHDIGYITDRKRHAELGSEFSKQFLTNLNFNKKEINIISDAILHHGGKDELDYTNIINISLILADKLDFSKHRLQEGYDEHLYLKVYENITDIKLNIKNNKLFVEIYSILPFDICMAHRHFNDRLFFILKQTCKFFGFEDYEFINIIN